MVKHSHSPAREGAAFATIRRPTSVCVLLILVGFNLRAVILAVPPILPLIRHDLALNYTATGLLTALPVLVLAASAWPAGLLSERIGAQRCVSLGLALLSVGALLRALVPQEAALFLFTVIMGLGVALAQTAVPVLVRSWFPAHIGLVSALYSDGLIIGEAVAAGITVPLMLQLWGIDAWRATFVLWSSPVIALLMFWIWLTPPHAGSAAPPAKAPAKEQAARASRGRVATFHLGIMLGAGSLVYFGMNSWIPSYNQAIHFAELTPAVLTILNVAQLPSSIAVTLFAQRLLGRRWPFVAAGAVCVVSSAGWVFTPAPLEPLWAALLGASSALVFTLGIALPPLLAAPAEVARLTGITISLTYAVAFVGPLIGGQLWDLFQLPAIAFLPVALASVALIVLGALLPAPPDTALSSPAPPTA
jgi:MFS transporter, CP family, cyanate transporter